jgi:hypothetical protein
MKGRAVIYMFEDNKNMQEEMWWETKMSSECIWFIKW